LHPDCLKARVNTTPKEARDSARIYGYSQTMPSPSFRVGRSVTGLGLFASKPIARNAYIVTYRGRRIPTAAAQERERRFGAKFMFEVNRRWTIDGSSRRNVARYINHSCRPNAEALLRKGRIVFVALRRIGAGEEITLDYGKEYFDLFIRAAGCRCAACCARAAVRRRRRKVTRSRSMHRVRSRPGPRRGPSTD
jgi:hypothetical protein